MYRKLYEPKVKKQTTKKKPKSPNLKIKMIKNLKMNPILKSIYLLNLK